MVLLRVSAANSTNISCGKEKQVYVISLYIVYCRASESLLAYRTLKSYRSYRGTPTSPQQAKYKMKYQHLFIFYVRYMYKLNHISLKCIVTFLCILTTFHKIEN